jgi:hypothetical protein
MTSALHRSIDFHAGGLFASAVIKFSLLASNPIWWFREINQRSINKLEKGEKREHLQCPPSLPEANDPTDPIDLGTKSLFPLLMLAWYWFSKSGTTMRLLVRFAHRTPSPLLSRRGYAGCDNLEWPARVRACIDKTGEADTPDRINHHLRGNNGCFLLTNAGEG